MADYTLIATATFGVESIVADELKGLGYGDLFVENGRVTFPGSARDIARCNIGLRCADRLLMQMASFEATDFEELFQQTRAVAWEDLIPADGKMHVTGKSVRSKLQSVPDCQAIVKKAVVEAMKRKYHGSWFPETGPVYKIEVALAHDRATLTVDTSGPGLHKRGYRTGKGEAPLKETLAAAMVLLSRWEPGRELADPFCGSGTIPIEAALIGRHIAPGIGRSFVAETWPTIAGSIWREARAGGSLALRRRGFQGPCLGHERHRAEGGQGKRGSSRRCRRRIVSEPTGRSIQVGQEIRLHRLQPALWREDRRHPRRGAALPDNGGGLLAPRLLVSLRPQPPSPLRTALRPQGGAEKEALQRQYTMLSLPVPRSPAPEERDERESKE